MATMIALAAIRVDGGTQPRAAIDFDAVGDYMDAMKDGVKFPAITVFYDGSDYWLADGFHRVKAAFGAEMDQIACDVHQGTQQDAQWFSFSANKSNGLRRTNEDKQRAVKAALAHPKSGKMSDSAIARHVGVQHQTVANWRTKVSSSLAKLASDTESKSGVSNESHRLCSDGRVMNTASIGKRRTVSISEPSPTADAYIADEQYAEFPIADEPAVEEIAPVAQPEEPPICDRKVAGSTPAVGSTRHPAPPKPTPSIDRERESVELLRSIFDLAEHQVSASDVMEFVSGGNIALVYQKARAAFEFIGFVFDAAGKRQRGVA